MVRHRRRFRVTVGTTPTFTTDIGPGGFSAELMRVQNPGTTVQGTIRLNGTEIPYTGQVAWAKAGEPHMSIRGRMGIRFTVLPTEVAKLLGAPALSTFS